MVCCLCVWVFFGMFLLVRWWLLGCVILAGWFVGWFLWWVGVVAFDWSGVVFFCVSGVFLWCVWCWLLCLVLLLWCLVVSLVCLVFDWSVSLVMCLV